MGFQTRRIEANGISYHLIDEGSGPAVLLLHGFPDTSTLWRAQIPALVGAGFPAVAPRFSGRGPTPGPPHLAGSSLCGEVPPLGSPLTPLGSAPPPPRGRPLGA